MNNKIQSTISLCRRARFLMMGFDQVKDGVDAGLVKTVFTAQDLSEKTTKEVMYFCNKGQTPLFRLPVTKAEVGTAVGKSVGVFAVTDAGLAKTLESQGEELTVKEE